MKLNFPEPEVITYPTLLCSYALYDYCVKRYPARNVVPEKLLGHEDFIYWSRTGLQRTIRRKKEVWALGEEWPMIVRVR